jgi:arginyl-tRNA synthetase
MKSKNNKYIFHQLNELFDEAILEIVKDPKIKLNYQIDRTKNISHGDFSCNAAMTLSKHLKMKPFDLAQKIMDALGSNKIILKTEIAGPGFINIFIKDEVYTDELKSILKQNADYGKIFRENPKKILIEYVSANPTGPLHVGHGRGAAYGSTMANILKASGEEVIQEYYVNDGGRQMDILALSVYLRYLQLNNESFNYPEKCYQAEYVEEIALNIHREKGFQFPPSDKLIHLLDDNDSSEESLDNLINELKNLLNQDYDLFFNAGLDSILSDIKHDLGEFGVTFDIWASEKKFLSGNIYMDCIQKIKDSDFTYEKDGALWFSSMEFGDDKDRVLIRENGQPTYFASDLAYHIDKYERGFDQYINVWGADHHGYLKRMEAGLEASKKDPKLLKVIFIQFVSLFKKGEKVQMSTRSGNYITLRELRDEVGNDATRFFYVSRSSDQHLDFDMTLAVEHSNENPVFYVQYAHARLCSILRQADLSLEKLVSTSDLSLLTNDQEINLMKELSKFPEHIEMSSKTLSPQIITSYAKNISSLFHTNYAANKVIVDNEALMRARLSLCYATKFVINNVLDLIGVSAPEKM